MVIAFKNKWFIVTVFLITLQFSFGQRIAIMGAMDEELQVLKEELKQTRIVEKGGLIFYTGKLQGHKVVLIKAGVGKVNAAYSTAVLFNNFKVKSLLFTGVAGGLGPNVSPGNIVLGQNLIQYDFGKLENETFTVWPFYAIDNRKIKQPLYLESDPDLLKLALRVADNIKLHDIEGRQPQFFTGTIATGDTFVNSTLKAKTLFTEYNALATEMEGAAVAQICTFRKIPFLVIRSCSDNANTNAHVDYKKFVVPAANNSAKFVLALLAEY